MITKRFENYTYSQLYNEFDSFRVTGFFYHSRRRFSQAYNNIAFALGINLWNGSLWGVKDGKRKLIKRVYN